MILTAFGNILSKPDDLLHYVLLTTTAASWSANVDPHHGSRESKLGRGGGLPVSCR